uniref:lysophospholipid acyltransferase 7-like n=1 Tax=Styela clava TaxID=7725 RepID=UPI00193A8898|nr:lysophospholipid acyltransferase 7-like [Styela clava]
MIPLSEFIDRDYAYIAVVAVSIFLGGFTRKIKNVETKKLFTFLVGFTIVSAFCGAEVLHSLITIIIGTLLIKQCSNRSMPKMVFLFSFLYRIFFCLSSFFTSWRDDRNLANGIQLVLTIKMICVAYEVDDFRRRQANENAHANGHSNGVGNGFSNNHNNITTMDKHKTFPLNEEPSFFDIICYMYCFLGIGTGPFYRYRTYHDMIFLPQHISKPLPAVDHIISRLSILTMLIIVSVGGGMLFGVKEMKSDEFYERSFFYRFFYVLPIGAIGMSRYGVIWFLSEFGFAMSGLGVYPESMKPEPGRGPTNFHDGNDDIWGKKIARGLRYSFESTRNVYIVQGLTAKTYAKTFRWWNCTVQWWLAHFIYASKLFSGKPVFIRWLAVAIVSAVWHGFKAGYYFSFVGMTYVAFAEFLLLSQVGARLNKNARVVFDLVHYLLYKAVGIGSFMTTFSLSNYSDVMRYLASVYYGIYGVATASIILSVITSVVFSMIPKETVKREKTE